MQAAINDTPSNAALLRQVLADMGLTVSMESQQGLPFGTRVTLLEFREPRWTCGIFTTEGLASLRFYATIAIAKEAKVPMVRVLEAVNYANFHFLVDFVMDFDDERGALRLRTSYVGPEGRLMPSDIEREVHQALSICQYWTKLMSKVLDSNRPVAESMGAARTELRAEIGIPASQDVSNL